MGSSFLYPLPILSYLVQHQAYAQRRHLCISPGIHPAHLRPCRGLIFEMILQNVLCQLSDELICLLAVVMLSVSILRFNLRPCLHFLCNYFNTFFESSQSRRKLVRRDRKLELTMYMFRRVDKRVSLNMNVTRLHLIETFVNTLLLIQRFSLSQSVFFFGFFYFAYLSRSLFLSLSIHL